MQTVLLILCIIICMIAVFQTILIYKLMKKSGSQQDSSGVQQEILRLETSLNASQQAYSQNFDKMAQMLREEQKTAFSAQQEKLILIEQQTTRHLEDSRKASEMLNQQTEERMRSFSLENSQKLNQIESTVQKNLEEMRTVIDEKMQKTLEERLQKGFTAQQEKLTLIEQQTTRHLEDSRKASETLNQQTEERMRSFSLENSQKLNQIESTVQKNLEEMRTVIDEKMQKTLEERLQKGFTAQQEKLTLIEQQTTRHLEDSRKASETLNQQTEERMRSFSLENSQKLNQIESTVQKNLAAMRGDQNQQLDEMRKVVDEKMQKVLNERMQQAFSTVTERLEQVHKGLGEMQTLAGSVGDLKKLLTNVKTRGEIGEIQLENLLADILSETQYVSNAKLGTGTVEFAVKIPDTQNGEVLLPIDSKFPGDTYQHLLEAYDSGDKREIQSAQKLFADRIRSEAQDILKKYISPPVTTDFGILFLPTEGLYTEAVRGGLMEEIFRKYHIFITSPSTLAAMLMTLQIGFRSVAVQKRSSEVWQILGEVRTEFNKFADALAKTQDKLSTASEELEKLVGVRTRQMHKKLNNVQNYLTEDSSARDN